MLPLKPTLKGVWGDVTAVMVCNSGMTAGVGCRGTFGAGDSNAPAPR